MDTVVASTTAALVQIGTLTGEIFLAVFAIMAGVGLLAAGVMWGYHRIKAAALGGKKR